MRRKFYKSSKDISKTANLFADMFSENPIQEIKWVDYRIWWFMQGYRFDGISVDEILEEWKKICVPKMRRKKVLEKIRKYIMSDLDQEEQDK